MEIPLPTGDILSLFSIPPRMLSSFKCIIWLALAATAELPPVVRAFLAFGRYVAHRFAGLPSPEFEWCVGVSLYLNACVWTEADSSPCDLTDVWNEVRSITIVSFDRGLMWSSTPDVGCTSE